jgi:hypothetical protein
MSINPSTNWVLNLYRDGIVLPPLTMVPISNITLSIIDPSSLRDPPEEIIADIIGNCIKFAESRGYKECINEIDKAIFKYFRSVAGIFDKALTDETELPEIIDILRKKGYISIDVWRKLLDLLLILDGLKMQDEILDQDLKPLREISEDLKRQKIEHRGDNGGNLLYFYAEAIRY